jgi:hypothetical protein
MGYMTDPGCIRWQGEVAMQSLGRLEPEVALALQAHLDGCAECREQAAELAPLAAALTAASPAAVEDSEVGRVPPRLQESVLHRLGTEARRERRRSRRRVGVVATVATGLAAAAVAVVSMGSPAPTGRVVTLSGTPGTAATVTLVRSSSGSDVTLREHGQPVGQDFVVTIQSNSGTWWQAGSYHTSSLTVRAQLTCAVEPYEINRVWVRDSNGITILSGYVH